MPLKKLVNSDRFVPNFVTWSTLSHEQLCHVANFVTYLEQILNLELEMSQVVKKIESK